MAPDLTRFRTQLVPARPDLAATGLEGKVEAARFVTGEPRAVTAPLLDLRLLPDPGAGLATQLLHGEAFTVYEDRPDGFSWGASGWDGYVGYVASSGLGSPRSGGQRVSALGSHVYSAPDVKAPILAALPCCAVVPVAATDRGFCAIAGGGYVPAAHLRPLAGDPIDHARRFIGAPYLWGGRSVAGLDCSALVQLAFMAAGLPAPRDSDMQEAGLGAPLDPGAPLARGDLVFWRGHVGLISGPDMLIHANAHHMAVVEEPFGGAEARIVASGGGAVTLRRRLLPSAAGEIEQPAGHEKHSGFDATW